MLSTLAVMILTEAIKYGPDFVAMVVKAMSKKDVTIQEIETLFANVKPYEAYGIPVVAPTCAQ